MGRLIYGAITSIDGYVNDASGGFDWAAPDPEVHQHVNDVERGVSTYLYGRRMYEIMSFWADPPQDDGPPSPAQDYATVWQSADKIVYSTTLPDVTTPRTQLRRSLDPAEVRALVDASDGGVSVGGPALAAEVIDAGLIDEIQLWVCPVAVGPGGAAWVRPGTRLRLEQRELRRFASGVVYVRYDVRR